jgi:dipeptidyl aminopeptidase/acylaminoacyl peptidase
MDKILKVSHLRDFSNLARRNYESMKCFILICFSALITFASTAQNRLTPELLWQLGRVSPMGITKDGNSVLYKVTYPDVKENKFNTKYYTVSITDGKISEVTDYNKLITNDRLSPDGQWEIYSKMVPVEKVLGSERHEDLEKSNAYVFDALNYRHWDYWRNGHYNHIFLRKAGSQEEGIDLMKNEPYDCPQSPFGGHEDFIWSPGGKSVVYVSKKKSGTAAATSTNTDIFEYHLDTKKTVNLTEHNRGYDIAPQFNERGELAYLQMARDGYEADKQDLIVRFGNRIENLTAGWDGTVQSFRWAPDNDNIYFLAPTDGTIQLFIVNLPKGGMSMTRITQLTSGVFDVTSIIGFKGDLALLGRSSMNQANEIYSFNLKTKQWRQLSKVNEAVYKNINFSRIEKHYFTTTDNKRMLTWVIYPPNFDPKKKYPTLLYCQGGPQSALSQFYSFRWNFQLMAAQGYIVVAPNRRGMPGHGVSWNEEISKDWGGQVMRDYLTAIDEMAKKPFVDENRLGAVGASYGGYSVFWLAGNHNNRFKSFISHCGVFNLESMYGTTEEVFFTDWDLGGAPWQKNENTLKAYQEFNPIKYVTNWNTPILIIQGGKDYRVPIGQGQEAFQAAQLLGIKSRFIYFPEENHWVLQPQNGLVWQREFFKWLEETL